MDISEVGLIIIICYSRPDFNSLQHKQILKRPFKALKAQLKNPKPQASLLIILE